MTQQFVAKTKNLNSIPESMYWKERTGSPSCVPALSITLPEDRSLGKLVYLKACCGDGKNDPLKEIMYLSPRSHTPKKLLTALPLCSTTKSGSISDSISITSPFLPSSSLDTVQMLQTLWAFLLFMKTPPPPFIAACWLPWLNPPGFLDSNSKGMAFRAYEMAQKVKGIKSKDWSLISRTPREEGGNCFQVVSFRRCLKLDYLTRNYVFLQLIC